MTKDTNRNRGNNSIRKLRPRARMPRESVLSGLSESQRETLFRLLNEQMECVYDASFRSLRPSSLESSGSAAAGDDAAANHAPAGQNAAVEGELSLQFDFCRRQTARVPRRFGGETIDGESGRALLRGRRADGARKVSAALVAFSSDQERIVFQKYNYYRYVMMCLVRRFAGKTLPAEAARRLLRWNEAALQVRNDIARTNLGLVPSMVERSRLTGVDFAELISEGQMALLRSIDKFDASRGFKFSTYACRAILTSISRAVALMARQRARFPVGYDPDLQKCGVIEHRREEIEGSCVTELRELWTENTAYLTPVERRILSQRFGINNAGGKRGEPKTLRQVAQVFGVTKERVRQIQNKALSKLRTALDEQVFADTKDEERACALCS